MRQTYYDQRPSRDPYPILSQVPQPVSNRSFVPGSVHQSYSRTPYRGDVHNIYRDLSMYPYGQPVDPDKKTKKSWHTWLSGSPVLLLSILVHILFAVIAALLIVQRIQNSRPQTFSELTVTRLQSAASEHQAQMLEKKKTMTTPDIVEPLTVPDLNPVNLPAVSLPADSAPAVDGRLQDTETGTTQLGMADTGLGQNPDMSIDTSKIAASIFGIQTENGKNFGLTGTFYDLKQTKDHKATDVEGSFENYYAVLQKFINDGFADKDFSNYFQAPKQLYLPQLCVPYIDSSAAPKAFGVENQVQASFWAVVYKGKITVPTGGMFRFVGFADNLLQVMVDGRLVFSQAGWEGKPLLMDKINHAATGTYNYSFPVNLPSRPQETEEHFDFICGDWMHFQEGSDHKIEILIGDDNGLCGFWLMVQQKDRDYDKTKEGSPILPIFQVSNIKMPGTDADCPPFDKVHPLNWAISTSDDDNTNPEDTKVADNTVQ